MRPVLNTILFLAFFVVLSAPLRAGELVYTSWGKAISGYDTVAYFRDGKPVEGDSGFTHEWMGAKWYFANATNRDAFAAEPEKYAPPNMAATAPGRSARAIRQRSIPRPGRSWTASCT